MLKFKLGTHHNPKYAANNAPVFNSLESAVKHYYYKPVLNNLITVFTRKTSDFGLICFDLDAPFNSDIALWARTHFNVFEGKNNGFATLSRSDNTHLYFRVSPTLRDEIFTQNFNGVARYSNGKPYIAGNKRCEFKAFGYGLGRSEIADNLGFNPCESNAIGYSQFMSSKLRSLRVDDDVVLNLMKWFYPDKTNPIDDKMVVSTQAVNTTVNSSLDSLTLDACISNYQKWHDNGDWSNLSTSDSSTYILKIAVKTAGLLQKKGILDENNLSIAVNAIIPDWLDGSHSNEHPNGYGTDWQHKMFRKAISHVRGAS